MPVPLLRVPVLVLTGPVGVGKTAVGMAVSKLLDDANTAHALIDLDWFRWCHPSPDHDPFHVALGLRNLASVWTGYPSSGARRLILVDIVEAQEEVLASYRVAVPGADVIVVRLRASLPTIQRRLEGREPGQRLEWHQRRAAELQEKMEHSQIGDLIVDTEATGVNDIAQEVLTRARWIGPLGQ